MRTIAAVSVFLLLSAFTTWETNFDKAKINASHNHAYILLSFSGSDWCGPCIKLHHDFFESPEFTKFSESNLVLLNADFPRQKKNQLPKTLQQQNDKLADTYNATGSFPFTVLLTADGKLIKFWDGIPKMSVEEFVEDIKKTIDASK